MSERFFGKRNKEQPETKTIEPATPEQVEPVNTNAAPLPGGKSTELSCLSQPNIAVDPWMAADQPKAKFAPK